MIGDDTEGDLENIAAKVRSDARTDVGEYQRDVSPESVVITQGESKD